MNRYILLYAAFLIYSFGGVCSKLAGRYALMSAGFLFFYGFTLFLLLLYAVLWQQILKHFPLVTAHANKSVVFLLGMLWGALFFNEQIKWNMVFGSMIVMGGVFMLVTANE